MTVNGEARRPDLRKIGDMGRLYLNINETPEPECNITGVEGIQLTVSAAATVMKAGLPQHGVVEKTLDEDHFRIAGACSHANEPPLAPGKNRCGGAEGEMLRP
jgi:hypothetical protein